VFAWSSQGESPHDVGGAAIIKLPASIASTLAGFDSFRFDAVQQGFASQQGEHTLCFQARAVEQTAGTASKG